jgi:aryl-alcohol dehydrogenase-like predicted oxidoreductase
MTQMEPVPLQKSMVARDLPSYQARIFSPSDLLAGRRDQRWGLMLLTLHQSVGTLTWSPLVWGRLTGRIRHGQPVPEASRRHSLAQADVAPPRPRFGGRCTFFLTRPYRKRPDRGEGL